MFPHTLPVTETPLQAFYTQQPTALLFHPSTPYYVPSYPLEQQPSSLVLPQQHYRPQLHFPVPNLYPKYGQYTMSVPIPSPTVDLRANVTSITLNNETTDQRVSCQNARPRRPRYQDMVEVYNADTFIKKVPIKLLVRFSKKAAEAFPPSAPQLSSETRRDVPRPPRVIDQATGRPISKRLYLNVDAPENPTHLAVGTVIKWMFDNEDTPRESTLISFGPPRLHELDLLSLLDVYQAVLAFGMRPFPSRIKHEIQRRVTDTAPTLDVFRQFAEYIPAQDPVTVRLLTSHYDWYREGHYAIEDVHQISMVIRSRPDIEKKWQEIYRVRERKRERQLRAQEEKTSADCLLQDGKEDMDTDQGVALQDTVGENSIESTRAPPEGIQAEEQSEEAPSGQGRRRNRRKQQAAGQAKDKQRAV